MEKNPFEIKFHNEFVSLIENMSKIFRRDRDIANTLKEYYVNYKKLDRFNFIHQVVETLEVHIESIRQHDESIFVVVDDKANEVFLLPNLDFRKFWGSEYLESSHKISIWRYLTNLYVLGCHYIKKNDSYFHDMLKSLKVNQMLERQLEKEEKDEAEKNRESNQLTEELQRLFKGLFTENSVVFVIFNLEEVQEVFHSLKKNPLETIKRFMNNNGETFAELMESVASKIKSKIISGELDRFKIDQDIERLGRVVDKLKHDLPKDPRFKKMFDMIKKNFNLDLTETFENPESSVKQFTEKFQEKTGIDLDNIQNGNANGNTQKLEELIKQTLEESVAVNNDAECDVQVKDLVSAMNDILGSVS